MKLKKVVSNKKYIRNIEGMGEGLAFFEISAVDKRIGQNYHVFYEDMRKPPLDIAINPDDGMLEYVSCFVQDEMINDISNVPVIINENTGICICDEKFHANNVNITINNSFKFWKVKNEVLVLREDIEGHRLSAYKINDFNNLLFLGDDFVGIQFKGLNRGEMEELYNSKCL